MANESTFEQEYSLDVARLRPGRQVATFDLNRSFFEHFDFGLSQEGRVTANLEITKYSRHIDVTYHIEGAVTVPCDRCLDPYDQAIDSTHRIIYSFDPDPGFEDTEVIQVEEDESQLVIAQELYDFVQVSIPFRKVPSKKIHRCDPGVLAVLGLDEDGKPIKKQEAEEEIDPRWEALKKLKDPDQDN